MKVFVTKNAQKGLDKAPVQVRKKFIEWTLFVTEFGLEKVRQHPGYHDEPIEGRKGERSVRLNQQWRTFYIEDVRFDIETQKNEDYVRVLEVTPHVYKKK